METQFGSRWNMWSIICGFKQSLMSYMSLHLHEFLIAKLEACGFTYESLKLINSYLSDRKHRTKINSSYSSFQRVVYGERTND